MNELGQNIEQDRCELFGTVNFLCMTKIRVENELGMNIVGQ